MDGMSRPKIFSNWDKVPVLVDTKTAALILGVSPRQVLNYINTGALKAAHPTPRKVVITKEALMEFGGVI